MVFWFWPYFLWNPSPAHIFWLIFTISLRCSHSFISSACLANTASNPMLKISYRHFHAPMHIQFFRYSICDWLYLIIDPCSPFELIIIKCLNGVDFRCWRSNKSLPLPIFRFDRSFCEKSATVYIILIILFFFLFYFL